MGNFGSKEDILSEIEGLFKKINSGKLTLDELEDLVSLSRELHERSVILRYKAFEEKIFGERPVAVEVPQMEVEPEVTEIPEIEESVPTIEADYQNEELEEEIEDAHEEGPSFEIEVKPMNEPVFGFSLFGDDEEKEESVSSHSEPIVQEIVDEEEESLMEEVLEESIDNTQEEEEWSSDEITNETDLETEEEIEEPVSNMAEEVAQETATRPISDVERAHAENLARFFNKSQTQEPVSYETPREAVTSFNTFDESPSYEATAENNPVAEELEEEVETHVYQTSEASIEEEEIEEPQSEPTYFQEERIEEVPVYSNNSNVASSIFVHKFNQVSSDLASSQFGLVKLDSLLGSFGLNERLQFINELFDGSSEGFSNAIKYLDQQASAEHAKTKVAEYAVENNWDVESETVVEFMQKIVRRYA